MRYAIIKDGVVENVIAWDGEAAYDPGEGFEAVRTDDAQIGWTYDGEAFTPPVPAPSEAKALMPVSFWLLRLSVDEMKDFKKLDLQQKALTVDDYDDPAKEGIVSWAVFMEHFNRLTNEIDLAHPLVQQGVGLFGILAGLSQERVGELLTPPAA